MDGDRQFSEEIQIARKFYTEIKSGWEATKTLGWELSVSALTSSLRTLNEPVTVAFLDSYFDTIIRILSQQSTKSLGSFERDCIEKTLLLGLDICLKTLAHHIRYFPVLIRILDPSTLYYSGQKINMVHYPGFPTVRMNLVRRFSENGGFKLILNILLNPETHWLGAENLQIIVRAMFDSIAFVDGDVKDQLLDQIMTLMLNLSDETSKKEHPEHVALLIRCIKELLLHNTDRLTHARKLHLFNTFWLNHTLKGLDSQSLVLRLSSWEQVHEIIKETASTRPFADSYIVKGAGNEDANGIYTFDKIDVDGAPIYIKQPANNGVPLLTLFRCTMRNKSKWWFLSLVDKERPGTEKDIDYYQHKSKQAEEREPPCRGWVTSPTNSNKLVSIEPPPVLVRVGKIIPDGATEDMILSSRFPTWALNNDLLGKAFTSSPHREVISRSSKLVQYLTDCGLLEEAHMHLIWKAAVNCHDTDILDEILSLLASVSTTLNEDLFQCLSELILTSLEPMSDDSSNSTPHASPSAFAKAALFVEKFAKDSIADSLNSLSDANAARLLAVVWALYKNPQFDSLKSSAVIQEFLSKCLGLPVGQEIALKNARECMDQLTHMHSSQFANQSSDVSAPMKIVIQSRSQSLESSASRIIQTLQFLLSRTTPLVTIVELEKSGLTVKLVEEVNRFVTSNRSKLIAGTVDQKWYSTELYNRLYTIRRLYGLYSSFSISIETIDTLWALLSALICEQEAFFAMLKSGIARDTEEQPMADFPQFVKIFQTIICDPAIRWSQSTEEMFLCFELYYHSLEYRNNNNNRLDIYEPRDLPPRLGLDTLWQIVLNIPIRHCQRRAIDLLVKSYEELLSETQDAHVKMIRKIYEHLVDLIQILNRQSSNSTNAAEGIVRSLDLLEAVISRSIPSSDPSHAMRSSMSQIRVVINFRRVYSQYNYGNSSTLNKTEKGSELSFPIETNRHQTLGNLRLRIAAAVNLSSASKIIFENDLKAASDHSHLQEVGISDGSELSCYSITQLVNSYNFDSQASEFDSRVLPSIADLLVKDDTFFKVLLSLIESSMDPAISRQGWRLLMLIPTQQSALAVIEKAAVESIHSSNGISKWKQILSVQSLHQAAYLLQVIDSFLLPGPDLRDEESMNTALEFKNKFVSSGGFSAVLEKFLVLPSGVDGISMEALATCLHILHFLMFEYAETHSVVIISNESLIHEFQSHMSAVVEKLLNIASAAAAAENTIIVRDALQTLNFMLQTPEAAALLIGNATSKSLLLTVLRSGSSQVREMACDFAIQVGRSQPVVFSWLLAALKEIQDASDEIYVDMFRALSTLMTELHNSHCAEVDWLDLANVLETKLLSCTFDSSATESPVLLGYLNLLERLVRLDYPLLSQSKIDFSNLANLLLQDYLFPIPGEENQNKNPICESAVAKQSVFALLLALSSASYEIFGKVLESISRLSEHAANALGNRWNQQISHDVRRTNIAFSGLKNQGCTCYLNALIQQLFMSVKFREAILSTPLKECHRSTVHHRSNADLVGCRISVEWSGGSTRFARVLQDDPNSGRNLIEYEDNREQVAYVLKTGRLNKETGYFTMAPIDGDEPATERETNAYRVLEQLQRTFCFMKHSKRRYFDPKQLVEACKTLNLNFNVYHQNDATEFCDQLLDRIELATGGKHTKKDIWSEIFQRDIFGGKFLTQKIPQDCDIYQTDKTGCGHWQSSRQESFLKIELIIRGKDNIDDSLADLVAGELMDGDNKISCDVCAQKKATIRRTCFEYLPNTLILHLKRFDLDFTTFETVKLNNRMAFETHINLLRYTKEGMEIEERRQVSAQQRMVRGKDGDSDVMTGDADPIEADLDPLDYEYELQGVLVHAGIAQGGHYYSFVRDSNTTDKWYRFDDEDVSTFTPDQIPSQCFGGPTTVTSSSGGVTSTFEEERTANALMLFFSKVRPSTSSTQDSSHAESYKTTNSSNDSPRGSKLVDGHQAFIKEVREWNLQHMFSRYTLDPDLHSFVRHILSSLVLSHTQLAGSNNSSGSITARSVLNEDAVTQLQWYKLDSEFIDPNIPRNVAKFGYTFLLDVVLHCRERGAIRTWISTLRNMFDTFPDTSIRFLYSVVNGHDTAWFDDYLLHCTDPMARNAFVQLLAQSVLSLASYIESDPYVLISVMHGNIAVNPKSFDENDTLNKRRAYVINIFVKLVNRAMDAILEAPSHIRIADEIFALIREICAVPAICVALMESRTVSRLVYLALPDNAPIDIKQLFERHRRGKAQQHDTFPLLQSVFEALAALLGVPQLRKVPLLQERNSWDNELVPEAREAFTTIFQEFSVRGGMDANELIQYREKLGVKMSAQQARNILDRFHTGTDNRLTLEGFLQFYTDAASYNPKDAWRDLNMFGYKNDLTRSATTLAADGPETQSALPDDCRRSLCHIQLFQLGFEASETCARAIARRLCHRDPECSRILIRQSLIRLREMAGDYAWGSITNIISEFLKVLLSIEDEYQELRAREALLVSRVGLASSIATELVRPSHCRANDYDRKTTYKRLLAVLQDLCFEPRVRDMVFKLAETEPAVAFVKGHLKPRPESNICFNDELLVSQSVIVVEGAGCPEVNGEYTFVSMKVNAGYYHRIGVYLDKPANFTLYKCTVQNNGSQWFISVTPDGQEPGTKFDTDFYYALPRQNVQFELLPPTQWQLLNNGTGISKLPAPQVKIISPILPQLPEGLVEMAPPGPPGPGQAHGSGSGHGHGPSIDSDSDHEDNSLALQDDDPLNLDSEYPSPGGSPHHGYVE